MAQTGFTSAFQRDWKGNLSIFLYIAAIAIAFWFPLLSGALYTLVALIWLTQSLRFVELVVNRGLSFSVFLELTSLLVPGFVAVILPSRRSGVIAWRNAR